MSKRKKVIALKSAFDGIGTAAGIAWPLFGILSSSLSFGIGGITTIALGSFCSLLFLTVSIPVFYLTYQNNKKEKNLLTKKLIFTIGNFLDQLYEDYLTEKSKQFGEPSDFRNYLQKIFNQQSKSKRNKIPSNLINFLSTHYLLFIDNDQLSYNEKNIKRFMQVFISQTYVDPPPIRQHLNAFFQSFVAVFGTIAGCSSGVMGLLAGLGILSGFNAVPLIGAAVLLAAMGIGLYMATRTVQSLLEETQKREVYKSIKTFNQETIQRKTILQENNYSNKDEKHRNGLTFKKKLRSGSLPGIQSWIPLSLFHKDNQNENPLSAQEHQSLIP